MWPLAALPAPRSPAWLPTDQELHPDHQVVVPPTLGGLYHERHLYTATEIASTSVIPAKAGIHKNPGFRVKPGMTNQDNAYVVML